MAGTAGVFDAQRNKLKFELKDDGPASVQEWQIAIWKMLLQPRPDRTLQETIFRSVMAYLDNLASYQASHHAGSSGQP